jgi:hypothetical protein
MWTGSAAAVVQLIGFLFMLYAAYFILPEIERHLYSCKLVTDAKKFWGPYSHAGKMYRYSMLRLVLGSPLLLERKGLIDVEQVNSLSLRHRRWVYLPMRFTGVGCCGVLTVGALLGAFG